MTRKRDWPPLTPPAAGVGITAEVEVLTPQGPADDRLVITEVRSVDFSDGWRREIVQRRRRTDPGGRPRGGGPGWPELVDAIERILQRNRRDPAYRWAVASELKVGERHVTRIASPHGLEAARQEARSRLGGS